MSFCVAFQLCPDSLNQGVRDEQKKQGMGAFGPVN